MMLQLQIFGELDVLETALAPPGIHNKCATSAGEKAKAVPAAASTLCRSNKLLRPI